MEDEEMTGKKSGSMRPFFKLSRGMVVAVKEAAGVEEGRERPLAAVARMVEVELVKTSREPVAVEREMAGAW